MAIQDLARDLLAEVARDRDLCFHLLDATGHALMLLELPSVLDGLIGGGPLRRLLSSLSAMIRDPALKGQWQTGLLIAFLGITAYILYRWQQEKAADLPVLAWLGLVTYLFDPRNQVYEQLAIVIPIMLWLLQQKPGAKRAWIVAAILVAYLFWG